MTEVSGFSSGYGTYFRGSERASSLFHAGLSFGLLFDLKMEVICSSKTSVDSSGYTALHP
jgi:hypothetical protein